MFDIKTVNSDLKPFIEAAWEKSGFENLTTVQMMSIPVILERQGCNCRVTNRDRENIKLFASGFTKD